MAVRVRETGEILCAAKHEARDGDTYLDDGIHYLLSVVARVLVTEPMHLPEGRGRGGHAAHGQWWWLTDVPDDVEIEEWET